MQGGLYRPLTVSRACSGCAASQTHCGTCRRFLETLPEPEEPDAPKAPLYGARPLLAVVPGDAPAAATVFAPGGQARGGAPPDGGSPRSPAVEALGGSPTRANGVSGSFPGGSPECGGPSGPGAALHVGAAGGGVGGGGDGGAVDRVLLYSLRTHCYARELTFGGRVRPALAWSSTDGV